MVNKKKLFDDLDLVSDYFPKLKSRFDEKTNKTKLIGTLDIVDTKGDYWDSFEIIITVGDKYPYEVPKVFETSGKIPRHDNRHVNGEGQCCTDIDHNLIYMARRGIKLYPFIKSKVYPYFANQLYYEKEKRYALGEWPHSFDGIRDFYESKLNITTPELAITILNSILYGKLPERNDPCMCGSGKFKNCHLQAVKLLKDVNSERLTTDLMEFKKLIKQ